MIKHLINLLTALYLNFSGRVSSKVLTNNRKFVSTMITKTNCFTREYHKTVTNDNFVILSPKSRFPERNKTFSQNATNLNENLTCSRVRYYPLIGSFLKSAL